MNTRIRSLLIALPLATAALTIATPAVANAADQPGPIIAQPVGGDPKPMDIAVPTPAPEPDPAPQVPDDKAPLPQDDDPQNPDDKAPLPQDDPDDNGPEGPGDITNGEPCPTHGVDCSPEDGDEPGDQTGDESGDEPGDQGCFTGCDLPEIQGDEPEVSSVAIPTRVDAGLAGSTGNETGNGNDLQLAFLAAGGLLITAGGAYAARNRARTRS